MSDVRAGVRTIAGTSNADDLSTNTVVKAERITSEFNFKLIYSHAINHRLYRTAMAPWHRDNFIRSLLARCRSYAHTRLMTSVVSIRGVGTSGWSYLTSEDFGSPYDPTKALERTSRPTTCSLIAALRTRDETAESGASWLEHPSPDDL